MKTLFLAFIFMAIYIYIYIYIYRERERVRERERDGARKRENRECHKVGQYTRNHNQKPTLVWYIAYSI